MVEEGDEWVEKDGGERVEEGDEWVEKDGGEWVEEDGEWVEKDGGEGGVWVVSLAQTDGD